MVSRSDDGVLVAVSSHNRGKLSTQKWQQYKTVNQQAATGQVALTPSLVYQSAERFFLTFDATPFVPNKSKKGKGRAKGTTFIQRTKYKVVKKTPYQKKNKVIIEKIE